MRTHQIEIDDDVMAFLKAQAEAFVDTPNTVLRRLLLRNDNLLIGSKHDQPRSVPEVASGVPKALEQILQVAYLTRFRSLDRVAATHAVADRHGVAFQTVLDKYARQLGLSAEEFDRLLKEDELGGLRELLTERFPKFRSEIQILESPALEEQGLRTHPTE